jgi:hypothetical protein
MIHSLAQDTIKCADESKLPAALSIHYSNAYRRGNELPSFIGRLQNVAMNAPTHNPNKRMHFLINEVLNSGRWASKAAKYQSACLVVCVFLRLLIQQTKEIIKLLIRHGNSWNMVLDYSIEFLAQQTFISELLQARTSSRDFCCATCERVMTNIMNLTPPNRCKRKFLQKINK